MMITIPQDADLSLRAGARKTTGTIRPEVLAFGPEMVEKLAASESEAKKEPAKIVIEERSVDIEPVTPESTSESVADISFSPFAPMNTKIGCTRKMLSKQRVMAQYPPVIMAEKPKRVFALPGVEFEYDPAKRPQTPEPVDPRDTETFEETCVRLVAAQKVELEKRGGKPCPLIRHIAERPVMPEESKMNDAQPLAGMPRYLVASVTVPLPRQPTPTPAANQPMAFVPMVVVPGQAQQQPVVVVQPRPQMVASYSQPMPARLPAPQFKRTSSETRVPRSSSEQRAAPRQPVTAAMWTQPRALFQSSVNLGYESASSVGGYTSSGYTSGSSCATSPAQSPAPCTARKMMAPVTVPSDASRCVPLLPPAFVKRSSGFGRAKKAISC